MSQKRKPAKNELYFQGDICLERVADVAPSGTIIGPRADGAVVLAEGEATGHCHAFLGGGVTMFRDDALARDIPRELYIGHVNIEVPQADLRHQEHDSHTLSKGTYRVRRQRQYDAGLARPVTD